MTTQTEQTSQTREATRITSDEVRERLDRGEPMVFVDVRSLEAWEASDVKIRGAVRMELDELESRLSELPRGRAVLTYCTCSHEASSAKAALLMEDHGFPDVHPLHGGLEAWQTAGGPVEPK